MKNNNIFYIIIFILVSYLLVEIFWSPTKRYIDNKIKTEIEKQIDSSISRLDSAIKIDVKIENQSKIIREKININNEIINQKENDLNKPIQNDTSVVNAINFLNEFSKNNLNEIN